jgi:hypothetical protein
MTDNNLAVQYRKNFTNPSIVIGTITVALAMITSFLPNIYLYLAYGVFPDAEHLLSAWGSIVVMYGAFYIIEPVSYFPIFGLTGTYIGILSGNISQIRLPAAATSQDVIGVQAGTEKGEIVGILGICGSVVTNIIFLTVAVIGGEAILRVLPAAVTDAMSKFILPSLFGACFTTMAVKKMSITLYALPLALLLRYFAVPAWICIIVCIFGVLAITYTLYKAKVIH